MTTPPNWIDRVGREHQAEAIAIWEEHRKAVREAQHTFDDALKKLLVKRDESMFSANERYREAKRALRDQATNPEKAGAAT